MFRTLGFDELLSKVRVEYGETVEEELVKSPWAVRSSLFKRTPLTKFSVAAWRVVLFSLDLSLLSSRWFNVDGELDKVDDEFSELFDRRAVSLIASSEVSIVDLTGVRGEGEVEGREVWLVKLTPVDESRKREKDAESRTVEVKPFPKDEIAFALNCLLTPNEEVFKNVFSSA